MVDSRLEQALALLSDVLGDAPSASPELTPWQEPTGQPRPLAGQVSATDRLSWWFRPSIEGGDPWATYFEPAPPPAPLADGNAATAQPAGAAEPPGRRAGLRLLLSEPDEEMIDSDADAVVSCLYDFVHAIGRGDVATALEECVAPDYHVMENDVEVDRDGLAVQLEAMLQRLRGWEIDVSLVEIPQPVLHPAGLVVYTELQIEAGRDGARQTVVHQRLAVFRQGRDRRWRIVALSPVSRP